MADRDVLIIGCGYVGFALAKLLITQDTVVYAITHSSKLSLPELKSYNCDLRDFNQFPKINTTNPLAVVFAVSASARDEISYQDAYKISLVNSIQALQDQKHLIERFIFVSSTAVYHHNNGEQVDETSPTLPEHFRGKILQEAENIVAQSLSNNTSLRFSEIYGPGRGRLLNLVKNPASLSSDQLFSYSNRIHRDDCARMLSHLLAIDNPLKCYIGSDNKPTLWKDILISLCRDEDLPPTFYQRPDRVFNKRCSNTLIRSIGFEFLYPTFVEGYRKLEKELQ